MGVGEATPGRESIIRGTFFSRMKSTPCITIAELIPSLYAPILHQACVLSHNMLAEYYGLGGLNSKHLLLTVPKAGKSKIKTLPDNMSKFSPFQAHKHPPSYYNPRCSRQINQPFTSVLIRILIAFMRAPLSDLATRERPHCLLLSH